MQRPTLKTALLIIFTVFILLLQFPLISIANQEIHIANTPLLYFYIFVTWILMIGLMAVVLERRRPNP